MAGRLPVGRDVHPIPVLLQAFDEMGGDEPAGAANEGFFHGSRPLRKWAFMPKEGYFIAEGVRSQQRLPHRSAMGATVLTFVGLTAFLVPGGRCLVYSVLEMSNVET
jgi:hypothetical protein